MNIMKNQIAIFLILTLLSGIKSQQILNTKDKNGLNINFSFGSCFSERGAKLRSLSIFEHISKIEPDVFAWIGDASYTKTFENAVQSFDFTKRDKGYRMLQDNNKTEIIGVWDDHDYGQNDGDKYYKHKNEMREIYLDFLDEPKDSLRRTQPGGIYTSYYLGKTKQVKLVLLDVRFSRDSFWLEHQDVLGQDQWKWLEDQFNDTHPNILIIAGGCQFIPDDRIIPEKWFPQSRKKLFDLIEKHKSTKNLQSIDRINERNENDYGIKGLKNNNKMLIKGVVLISGDVHMAEILEEPNSEESNYQKDINLNWFGYNLIEITSSGLTHSLKETNFPRFLIDSFIPNTFSEKKDRYMGLNFAKMKIVIDEQNKEKTKLDIKIQDIDDQTQLQIELQPWMKDQNQLKLSNSNLTREDHHVKRWIYQIFRNYFIDYQKVGVILSIIAVIFIFAIISLANICIKKQDLKIIKQKES